MPRPGRLDYGWAVVAGLCVTETVSWGIIYYGFPVMLRPMEAELGFSRAEITGAFSAGLAVAALAGLPVGRWIDRHGARSLMTVGSILATALVVLWASSHTLLALYSVWILMGLAMAAVLYEPAFVVLTKWFRARMPMAPFLWDRSNLPARRSRCSSTNAGAEFPLDTIRRRGVSRNKTD